MSDRINLVVDNIVSRRGGRPEALLAALLDIQNQYGYLPEEGIRRIADLTGRRAVDVLGVASFYSRFRFAPTGKHMIRVCVGTACFVKGADLVYEAFRQELRIPEGRDTDGDRLFTVSKVACLGCCMLAPAVQIDDFVYGKVTRASVRSVIGDFLSTADGGKPADSLRQTDLAHRGEIRLCTCTSCRAAGADRVLEELRRVVRDYAFPAAVKLSGCTGMSYRAPVVEIVAEGEAATSYGNVTSEQVAELVSRHFKSDSIASGARIAAVRLLAKLVTVNEPVERYELDVRDGGDADFLRPQIHIVTEGFQTIDPLDFSEYRASGGFETLKLFDQPNGAIGILSIIEKSGLRGRGGAGFPSAQKWHSVRGMTGEMKYLICNADEGDPGAFMDRTIIESFPFRVIEGMIVAGRVVGAATGYAYVRSEYTLALSRFREALEICRKEGIIGAAEFEIVVEEGAGAFVCGEETALIAAIEGRRGTPRARPPYPSQRGLFGAPTLVHNVETLASVPWIVRNGSDRFNEFGTTGSPGTKTFALAGKIERGGLIEVPMGMTISEVVERVGGGVQNGRTLKAVQIGGPSGSCIPANLCNCAVDFDALQTAGGMMGSGGFIVLDDRDCMVDISRYFMEFTQSESCGKCTCCRVGTKRMLEILERLCRGNGMISDIDFLEELARDVSDGSLCGLGRTSPNPVISALTHFRSEFEAHADGRCPSGRCRELITYTIGESCIGCTKCAQNCPVGAIEAEPYSRHTIDVSRCIRCGTCMQVCPSDAVKVESPRLS